MQPDKQNSNIKRLYELRLEHSKVDTNKQDRNRIVDSFTNGILQMILKANSFYNCGRIKSWVPYLYRQIQSNFIGQLNDDEGGNRIKLYEYQKEDCTFHSKGVWYLLAEEYNQNQKWRCPMTIIGSSNFSYRSYLRDSECQFYIVTKCPDF